MMQFLKGGTLLQVVDVGVLCVRVSLADANTNLTSSCA